MNIIIICSKNVKQVFIHKKNTLLLYPSNSVIHKIIRHLVVCE